MVTTTSPSSLSPPPPSLSHHLLSAARPDASSINALSPAGESPAAVAPPSFNQRATTKRRSNRMMGPKQGPSSNEIGERIWTTERAPLVSPYREEEDRDDDGVINNWSQNKMLDESYMNGDGATTALAGSTDADFDRLRSTTEAYIVYPGRAIIILISKRKSGKS